MKLKKGDSIIVAAGKDKGKKGKIEEVFPKTNMIVVPGINVYKRHTKKRNEQSQAGIIDKAFPMHADKVELVCPKCGKPTRIGFIVAKGEKERVCKKCGQKI